MAAPFEAVGDHDGFDLLSELPQALALLVMKQLTLRQRAVCSLVSTSWRQLFALPALWETLILTAENSSAGSDLSQDATCEHLPIFTQLRIAARGHVRCLHLIGFSLPGRERGFLEFVLANSFLRELLVHDCALRAGEARCERSQISAPSTWRSSRQREAISSPTSSSNFRLLFSASAASF